MVRNQQEIKKNEQKKCMSLEVIQFVTEKLSETFSFYFCKLLQCGPNLVQYTYTAKQKLGYCCNTKIKKHYIQKLEQI